MASGPSEIPSFFSRWASIRDEGRQGLGNNGRVRRRTPMGRYLQEKQLLSIPSRFAIAMENERWIPRNDLIRFKPDIPPRPEKIGCVFHTNIVSFRQATQGRAKYHYALSTAEESELDVARCNARPGKKNVHTATFPTELVKPRILSSCLPSGLVLDPFCRTGSAIEYAKESGRHGIGFETSEKFISAQ